MEIDLTLSDGSGLPGLVERMRTRRSRSTPLRTKPTLYGARCGMWADFLAETRFEALVRDLSRRTLTAAGNAWPDSLPWAGFAFNCSAA